MFKGKKKEWRILGAPTSSLTGYYSGQYCSYLVNPNSLTEKMEEYNAPVFGPFAWFGTEKKETDIYGPCCFELNFHSMLDAYQKCRSNGEICYRAGGPFVYKREVSYIVIICCKKDKEYQSYPPIQVNSSKCFIPPWEIIEQECKTGPPSSKKSRLNGNNTSTSSEPTAAKAGTLLYQNLSPGFSSPEIASSHVYTDKSRHENVVFAFYLPDDTEIHLPAKEGIISKNEHTGYCLKTKGPYCQLKGDPVDASWFSVASHYSTYVLSKP